MGSHFRIITFFLFLGFAIKLGGQEHATSIRNFILSWQNQISQEEFNDEKVNLYYGDSVKWYNSKLSRDSVIELISRDISRQQCYYYGSPNITEIQGKDHSVWQIFFSECNGVVSGMKQHYVIVDRTQGNTLQITGHSSLADDVWRIRQEQIAGDTIVYNNKRYFVLHRDTAAFRDGTHGICFVTDTLLFNQSDQIPMCTDDFGFAAIGNIYCAIIRQSPENIIVMKNITNELTEKHLDGAELVFGGFLCLHPQDIRDSSSYIGYQWTIPTYNSREMESGKVQIGLNSYYNYGDACWTVETAILFDSCLRRIVTDQVVRKPLVRKK